MQGEFGVVDLFAGPGGLAEGFSAVRGARSQRVFSIALSVEKEASAHQTLLLRSFLRQFEVFPDEYYRFLNGEIEEPDWCALYPAEMALARDEALMLELGTPEANNAIWPRLDSVRRRFKGNVILIGGPPCQAYSLVGRARNKGVAGYSARNDGRHFLYREYIAILDRLRPVAFVMENVKGLLSSTVDGERIFDQVLNDLTTVGDGYRLIPLIPPKTGNIDLFRERPQPKDFVVRAEDVGVPQARHRVIILGVRADLAKRLPQRLLSGDLLPRSKRRATVRDVIGGLGPLRSGISGGIDSADAWRETVCQFARQLAQIRLNLPREATVRFRSSANRLVEYLRSAPALSRNADISPMLPKQCSVELRSWLRDPKVKRLSCHTTRGHMRSDLARYLFAALHAEASGSSPRVSDFPKILAPDHANWASGKFADRFKVQIWDFPASTITSHISKDGHYFIHPDAAQCRSLTPREAARLQTFPDNYHFKGNRTQQYVQVGNAVPPLLAKKIGEIVHELMRYRK